MDIHMLLFPQFNKIKFQDSYPNIQFKLYPNRAKMIKKNSLNVCLI